MVTVADDGNRYLATYTNRCGSVDTADALLTVQAVIARQVEVSEFRLIGPNGSGDWYVNLRNTTGTALNLDGWTLTVFTIDAQEPAIALPAVTVPAGASYLVAGTGFSLGSYATPDLSVNLHTDRDGGVRVAGPDGTATDRAGITWASPGLREGTGIPAATIGSARFAFARSYAAGVPVDTDDNAADFRLLAADGATADHGPGTTLGAPSPRGLTSPIARNDVAKSYLYDPTRTASQAPNRVVTGTIPNRTLLVRRRIENTSGATINQLRLRITSMTTYGNTTSSQAILTTTSSASEPGISATTLDAPPSDPSGGGVGSTLTVDLPPGGLADGASVNVNLLFNVVRGGSFSFGYNAEISDAPAFAAGRDYQEISPPLSASANAVYSICSLTAASCIDHHDKHLLPWLDRRASTVAFEHVPGASTFQQESAQSFQLVVQQGFGGADARAPRGPRHERPRHTHPQVRGRDVGTRLHATAGLGPRRLRHCAQELRHRRQEAACGRDRAGREFLGPTPQHPSVGATNSALLCAGSWSDARTTIVDHR